jgi:hypothetical protein
MGEQAMELHEGVSWGGAWRLGDELEVVPITDPFPPMPSVRDQIVEHLTNWVKANPGSRVEFNSATNCYELFPPIPLPQEPRMWPALDDVQHLMPPPEKL